MKAEDLSKLHSLGHAEFMNFDLPFPRRCGSYAWAYAASYVNMMRLANTPHVMADENNRRQKLESAEFAAMKCNQMCEVVLKFR